MNKKALIIDDEAQVRKAIAEALRSLGWETEGAGLTQAAEALLASGETPFGMVFLPVSATSFGSLSEMAKKASRACLVVALADLDRERELRRAVFEGLADEFLPLPFTPGDIANIARFARGDGA